MKDDKVTNADELTRDSDGIAWDTAARLNIADVLTAPFSHAARTSVLVDDHLLSVMVLMLPEWMEDAVSSPLKAAAEGVVFACVVVVTHVASATVFDCDFFFVDLDFFSGSATLVLDVVGGIGAAAVVALGDI